MLYDENFFDGEALLLEDFECDLDNVWGEKNTTKQRRQKLQQVENRRRIEEIMAEKRYSEQYSDPYEEFEC